MKKYKLWMCLAILLSPSLVLANGETYFGVKAGSMSADVAGFNFSNATNIGVLVGYNINKNLAVEGEFTTSSSDADFTYLSTLGKWSIDTFAVYAVNRSSGDTYLKTKIGFLNENITVSVPSITTVSGTDSGISLGIGVGFKIGKTSRFELEYTLIEADVNMISAAYIF